MKEAENKLNLIWYKVQGVKSKERCCSTWNNSIPRDFESLPKIDGPPLRHFEQLWDEIKILKKKIEILEKQKRAEMNSDHIEEILNVKIKPMTKGNA
jgi:hypothetical protein